MGKLQIICLLSVVVCAIISTVQSVPVSDTSVQSENAAKCKKLCGFCGCNGFYCGDECLCECNSVKDGDAACVDTMKSNCKKLELPFEVLIQGPNVNRMVRSLLYSNPDEETCAQSSESSNLEKRSTISIYRPIEERQQDEILTAPKDERPESRVEESPINYFAAQKFKMAVDSLKTEPIGQDVQDAQPKAVVEKVESEASDTESNQQSDSADVERTNTKRHIIDVNQDISDFPTLYDDSFLYKRNVDEEAEEIASAPPAPVVPAPLMPKFRKALESIPTSDEIKSAWEAIRKDMNTKINTAISVAQKQAADLRAKVTPPPPPKAPSHLTPLTFNPFLKLEQDGSEVGSALRPVIPLLPLTGAEIAKNIAAATAAQTLRSNALIKSWNSNNLLTPWLLGLDVPLGSPPAEEGDDPPTADDTNGDAPPGDESPSDL